MAAAIRRADSLAFAAFPTEPERTGRRSPAALSRRVYVANGRDPKQPRSSRS